MRGKGIPASEPEDASSRQQAAVLIIHYLPKIRETSRVKTETIGAQRYTEKEIADVRGSEDFGDVARR